jgi:hypothetical protein
MLRNSFNFQPLIKSTVKALPENIILRNRTAFSQGEVKKSGQLPLIDNSKFHWSCPGKTYISKNLPIEGISQTTCKNLSKGLYQHKVVYDQRMSDSIFLSGIFVGFNIFPAIMCLAKLMLF